MTNKEIKKIKQELCEIHKKEGNNQKKWEQLIALAGRLNVPIPPGYSQFPIDSINAITQNIHTALQTEMMFNACVFAKWSCFCAAVAAGISLITAIAACVSIVVMLCSK
jgi:hypothetical protein